MTDQIAKWFALGFGSGLAPKAPGTFGTFMALPFFALMYYLPAAYYWSVLILMFVFGVWVCGHYADMLGEHDHGSIVWDEVVGYLITLYFVPVSWVWILAAFVMFRFFDIVKPWPIKWLDKKVHGGFGIMIDDVIAGLFAGWVLWGIHYVL